jgi:hypothetical protein
VQGQVVLFVLLGGGIAVWVRNRRRKAVEVPSGEGQEE